MRVVEPFDSQLYAPYTALGLDVSQLLKAKVAGHGIGRAIVMMSEASVADTIFERLILSEFGSLKAFLETENLIEQTVVCELAQRLVKAGCFEAELRAAALDYDGNLSQALGYAEADPLRVYGGALGEYLLTSELTSPNTGAGNGNLAQIEVLLHRAEEEWQASRILQLAQDLSEKDKRYFYREIVQKKLLAMWPTVQLEHCLYMLSELEEHLE